MNHACVREEILVTLVNRLYNHLKIISEPSSKIEKNIPDTPPDCALPSEVHLRLWDVLDACHEDLNRAITINHIIKKVSQPQKNLGQSNNLLEDGNEPQPGLRR